MQQKSVFTTGEIANLLHIHQTTVIDWVDKGLMKSYKTPGGHRRIGKIEFLKFLDDHNMPIPNILSEGISNPEAVEKHRHLHEGFQMGQQPKPADTFSHNRGVARNTKRRAKLTQRKK